MSNENDTFVIVMLMVTIVVMSVSLSAMHNSLAIKDKELEQMIEAQDKRIADMEQIYTYTIGEQTEEIEELTERMDEAELRLDDHMEMLTQIQLWQTEHDKPSPTPTPKARSNNKVSVRLSESEIRNIAALVYLESGSCSYKCQKAVTSVILNRMVRYKKTATQVIYEPGVFSPASRVRSTTPSAESLKAVRDVVKNGTTLPRNVVAFRTRHYHTFGRRYCVIDGVYFTAM